MEREQPMAIVAFSYKKMEVERTGSPSGQINIQNNVNITDVKEADLNIGKSSQKALRFTFEFTSSYQPDIAEIKFVGDVVDLRDEESIKEVLDEWKKNEKVPTDMMKNVVSTILDKCNVQAIILAKEMNLPAPVPLPKVKGPAAEQKEEKKSKK